MGVHSKALSVAGMMQASARRCGAAHQHGQRPCFAAHPAAPWDLTIELNFCRLASLVVCRPCCLHVRGQCYYFTDSNLLRCRMKMECGMWHLWSQWAWQASAAFPLRRVQKSGTTAHNECASPLSQHTDPSRCKMQLGHGMGHLWSQWMRQASAVFVR